MPLASVRAGFFILCLMAVRAFAVLPVITISAPGSSPGFGHSIAANGGEFVVGDYAAQKLYRYNTSGTQLMIYPSNLAAFAGFGHSTAFDGQLVLGAGPFNSISNNNGPAILFNAATGAPIQTTTGASFSYYGFASTISGNYYAVGANFNDGGSGRAYIYDRTTLALRSTILGVNAASFGLAMAGFGDVLTVGAPRQKVGTQLEAGSVFMYDANTSALLRTFTSPNSQDVQFGWSVAQRNGQVLIGAPYAVGGGAAYLFDTGTGALLQQFHDPVGNVKDGFGWSVAFDNSAVVVGAPGFATNLSGAAYVFDISSGLQIENLQDPLPINGSQFGWAVSSAGGSPLVSANANGGAHGGEVYIYAAIPEPTSLVLLCGGAALLTMYRSRESSLL